MSKMSSKARAATRGRTASLPHLPEAAGQAAQNRVLPVEERPSESPLRLALTVTEAGQALGISRAHVYRLLDAGSLASFRVGAKSRRVSVAALRAFIAAQEVASHLEDHANGWEAGSAQ